MEKQEEKDAIFATSELVLNIKSRMQQMNPAQKKIAKFILENLDEVQGMPIGEMARRSQVSEATVSRFVKFLGCGSYRDFQTEMVKSNALKHEKIRGYSDVQNLDGGYQLCKKIFESNIQSLVDTLSIIDSEALEKTADLIVEKRKLCILAQGRSMVTATSIRQRLYRLGISCSCYSDPHEQAITASLLGEGDLVMGISTFGRSKNLLKNLRLASRNKAAVIGVSSYRGTPLEKISDIMLVASNNEEASFGFEPSCSTVSQMVMLDCLYIMITQRMKEEAQQCFLKSCDAIESERE